MKTLLDPRDAAVALPKDKRQCIHVEVHVEELSEGDIVEIKRCTRAAYPRGRQGWLCDAHTQQLEMESFYDKLVPKRNLDNEHVEGIILHDKRAIAKDVIQQIVTKRSKTLERLAKGDIGVDLN